MRKISIAAGIVAIWWHRPRDKGSDQGVRK